MLEVGGEGGRGGVANFRLLIIEAVQKDLMDYLCQLLCLTAEDAWEGSGSER